MPQLTTKTFRRIAVFVLLALLVLVLLSTVFIDSIARAGLQWGLRSQGINAHIMEVDIGWRAPAVTIRGIAIRNETGESATLSSIHVTSRWHGLMTKLAEIEDLSLAGLQLTVIEDADGIHIAGIDLPANSDTPAEQQQENDATSQWQALIRKVNLRDIDLCLERRTIGQHNCMTLDSLQWQGNIAVKPAARKPIAGQASHIKLHDFAISDRITNSTVFASKNLAMEEMQWKSSNTVSLNKAVIDNLLLLESDQSTLLNLGQLTLTQSTVTPAQIDIGNIDINGMKVHLHRAKNGQFVVQERINTLLGTTTDTAEKPATASSDASDTTPSPRLRIGTLNITDTDKLVLVDDSLSSPLQITANLKQLQVKHIDTGKPDQTSEVTIDLTIDQHGRIQLAGTVTALQSLHDVDVNGTVRGLDLRSVGLYTEQASGNRISSGQLNANIVLRAKDARLDSELDLTLNKFILIPAEDDDDSELTQMLGIPANQALNLLRDGDNKIHLNIPISGNINAPSFDASDALRQALASAITTTVINYYTPFGLITVGKGIFDLATALRLEPVTFDAGDSTLKKQSSLKRIDEMMKERPGVIVSLCGATNLADRRELFDEKIPNNALPKLSKQQKQRLNKLGASRADTVKDRLITAGIKADRMVICDATYKAKGISGVTISL